MNRYSGKQIAVLGFGSSGEAAARLLLSRGASVTILDSAPPAALRERAASLGANLVAGPEAERDPASYDLGVLSPGIDPAVPLVKHFLSKSIPLIGELELSWEFCDCPAIGITGTNGKTTTTELVARLLNACGVKTLAAGNIGPAFAAVVDRCPSLDFVTLEVSSFQLETIDTFCPHISVWLNFTPDHLDRYPDMEAYFKAKLRIFENQTEHNFAIIQKPDLDRVTAALGHPLEPRVITFSATVPGGDFDLRDGVIHFRGEPVLALADTKLRGLHNAENLMAALAVGHCAGCEFNAMRQPLATYSPLPHRCEIVRTLDGVEYVNDSKATNIDALAKALLSEQRPVILIAGGKDKGLEFHAITDLVSHKARRAILIGEMAPRIAASWQPRIPCDRAASLAEAVSIARSQARPGDVVLFSPGTSSFDMFKNYADRGSQFRQLIQSIP